jgi:ferric-dicitrate binding protein FerR (iron transport regulator)
MSEDTDKQIELAPEEVTTARLLKLAGQRPDIPADLERRVYARVQEDWQKATRQPDNPRLYQRVRAEWRNELALKRRRRWLLPMAMAASVALVVVVLLQTAPPIPTQPVTVATVVRITGDLSVSGTSKVGREYVAGEQISTTAGIGLSLRLAGFESLRLDESTTIVAHSVGEFELLQGRVYVDTGDLVYRDKRISIATPFGTVTDVGTQFIVVSGADTLEVAVREGRVNLLGDGTQDTAIAGERLQVSKFGAVDTSKLAPHDEYWAWATELAPTFDIESRSLLDFLRWAARETGRGLEFEDEELRMEAMRTDLHGSIAGIAPLDAIATVVSTTRFHYRIEPDRIIVTR